VAGTQSLPRSARLRRAAEFQAVFQRGQREERRGFVALWRPAAGRTAGFATSRQIRGAVERNRARRRVREAYRRRRAAHPPGIAVVFVARPPALTQPFPELLEEMSQLMRSLGRRLRGAGGDA
jgi:ribonuclease P protein component